MSDPADPPSPEDVPTVRLSPDVEVANNGLAAGSSWLAGGSTGWGRWTFPAPNELSGQLNGYEVEDQLTTASQVADVTAVWNLPLGVHFLDDERGIFAQNATSDSSYSVMALWPGRQMTVPGWNQEFSYRATATAKLTLTVKRASSAATEFAGKRCD